jgi:hypothetical protein
MSAIGSFWESFKKAYRAEDGPREQFRGWRNGIRASIVFLAARAVIWAYRTGGWGYLLLWVAKIFLAAALTVIAGTFLWLLWRQLLGPVVVFVTEQGIVGCWRWLCEKVFMPIAYGRKGK